MKNRCRLCLAAIALTAFAFAIAVIGASGDSDADSSGECGNGLTWTYTTSDNTLKIEFTSAPGKMADYNDIYEQPWAGFRSQIKKLTIGDGVTHIGDSAFESCWNLTSLTIPGSVTTIGNWAFSGCSSLTTVTIPSSVTSIGDKAFYGCKELEGTLAIPAAVESIGAEAFIDCSKLTTFTVDSENKYFWADTQGILYSKDRTQLIQCPCGKAGEVTIPDHVTAIGKKAFSGCTGLTAVTIHSSVTSIGDNAFDGCSGLTGTLTIPSSVTSIGDYAFYYCSNLTTVTIPADSELKSIGSSAFSECTGLTTVTIPSSVTSIGSSAFYRCTGLTTVTIPSSVTSIGSGAFHSCTSLTTVTIPADSELTSIGNYVFYCCSNLTTVTIPSSVTSIGERAFYYCSLTTVTIPSSVTSIGNYAFDGCTGLTNVTFSEDSKLTTIGYNAFYGCTKLKGDSEGILKIPNSVTSIGSSAFSGCSSLTTVELPNNPNFKKIEVSTFDGCTKLKGDSEGILKIPNSVTSIDSSAFSGCSSLTTVELPSNSNLKSIGERAFDGCAKLKGDSEGNLVIPSSVTSIGKRAFYCCSNLTTVELPSNSNFKKIEESTFAGCTKLKGDSEGNLVIPSSVTSISYSAFSGCGMTTVTFSEDSKLTTIGDGVFAGCIGLTAVTIPNSVTSISNYAFSECSSLTDVTIPNSVTSIGYYAFSECSSLTTVTIPSSVTSIDSSAFSGCSSLTTVELPSNSNLKSIGECAFDGCAKLKGDSEGNLVIPSSVTFIGERAFDNCKELTAVTFSEDSKLTTIGDSAFGGCIGLTAVTIPNSVTSIGGHAFAGCTGLTFLCIPDKSYSTSVSSVFYGLRFYPGGTYNGLPSWDDVKGKGWYGDGKGNLYNGKLKVVFDTNGGPGNAPDSIEVDYGGKYSNLPDYPDPHVRAYFTGWFAEKNGVWIQVTKDADVMLVPSSQRLYAHWENYVKVTFDGNGNDRGSMEPQYIGASDQNKNLKANAFEKDGSEFGGWYEAADPEKIYNDKADVLGIIGSIDQPHMTLELIAKWDVVYNVIDNVTGGTLNVSSAVHHKKLDIMIRPDLGHSLPGSVTVTMGTSPVSCSYSGGVITILSGIIEGDLTVTGVCPEWQLTVTFDKGAGEGTMADQVIKYSDSSRTLATHTFAKEGYTFSGWEDLEGGSPVHYDEGADVSSKITSPTSTLNLTAQWSVNQYTVTVDTSDPGIASVEYMIGDGGTFANYTAPFKVVYGSKLTLRAVVVDGYEFKEWQPSGETDVQLVIGSVTGDMELAPKAAKLLPEPPGPTPPGPGPAPNPDPAPAPGPKPQVITVTVTFESVGGGHTSEDSVKVPLNSKIMVYGSTLVIGSGNATVKAIPDAGHVFSGWMMDEALMLGGGLLSDTVITASFGETVLVGMYIWKEPDKVDYSEGDRFDPAGLVIALRYSDGSEVHVDYEGNESRFSFDPSLDTPLKPSDDRVTVKYGGMSAVQEITVSENGFPWWIVLIVAALALLILFIILKRRKDEEEESVG